jgi:ABC-type multidrug transport system ATPase subunit
VKIELHHIGKKFNKHWLFKQLSYTIESHKTIAITGFNGSGKSTLLQILLGYQMPSTGNIQYSSKGSVVPDELFFERVSFVAPYLELPEELTLTEVLQFHFSFKQIKVNCSFDQMITQSGLSGSEHKQVKYFSSGMKQRLKLILAFFTVSEVLLLDEPTSNLDEKGIRWYRELLAAEHHQRTIVIASNQPYEYELSDAVLDITQQQA